MITCPGFTSIKQFFLWKKLSNFSPIVPSNGLHVTLFGIVGAIAPTADQKPIQTNKKAPTKQSPLFYRIDEKQFFDNSVTSGAPLVGCAAMARDSIIVILDQAQTTRVYAQRRTICC